MAMRLVTRSDFDGIVCGSLLYHRGIIDQWHFTHPRDMQEGKISITENDVIANVPYAQGCGLWFDHHISEKTRLDNVEFKGELRQAPSAARVIWDYYGGDSAFPERLQPLMQAVDTADSASYTKEDVLDPQDWIMISFVADPRTGLGRYHDFRIANKELMGHMIMYCASFSAGILLQLPDIAERVAVYNELSRKHLQMLDDCGRMEGNTVVLDFLTQQTIYPGNRFMVYARYPQSYYSIHILSVPNGEVSLSVGKSIFNKNDSVNLGNILLELGGGGHKNVGTVQIAKDRVNDCLTQLLAKLNG